jgi:hypothetical protein
MRQDRKCSFDTPAEHCPAGRRQPSLPSVHRAMTSKLSNFRYLMRPDFVLRVDKQRREVELPKIDD